MILIADSGSTKTDWIALQANKTSGRFSTPGLNPFFLDEEGIARIVANDLLPCLDKDDTIDALYFYGAGCVPEKTDTMRRALTRHLHVAGTVEVCTDLLAAARALCGRQPGIACILGTGSNSCFYDGHAIARHVSPLGFILGDEGSGAYLGKRLVGDLLKGQLPAALRDRFLQQYHLTAADILEHVYRRPLPNRFLASLSPFLAENLAEPCVRALVKDSFTAFLQRNVMQYDYRHYPVHFTGSIAYHYREVLEEAARETGIGMGTVTQSPLSGLAAYHRTTDGIP